jgi:hypothetical protein
MSRPKADRLASAFCDPRSAGAPGVGDGRWKRAMRADSVAPIESIVRDHSASLGCHDSMLQIIVQLPTMSLHASDSEVQIGVCVPFRDKRRNSLFFFVFVGAV